MLVGIQVIGLLFSLFMMYLSFLYFKRNEFGKLEVTIWILLWLFLAFITLFPTALNFLVKNVLSMKRPLDFYMICGFLVVILLTFYNYSMTKKNNLRLERIVRKLASDNYGKETHKDIEKIFEIHEKK
jgi:hypothetical protein